LGAQKVSRFVVIVIGKNLTCSLLFRSTNFSLESLSAARSWSGRRAAARRRRTSADDDIAHAAHTNQESHLHRFSWQHYPQQCNAAILTHPIINICISQLSASTKETTHTRTRAGAAATDGRERERENRRAAGEKQLLESNKRRISARIANSGIPRAAARSVLSAAIQTSLIRGSTYKIRA
jgi:hypothetical protein